MVRYLESGIERHQVNRDHLQESLVGEKLWVGALRQRKCRDLFMLLVFIVAWAANYYVAFKGVWGPSKGDPDRLLNGYDLLGRTCGVSRCYDHIPECSCTGNPTVNCDLTNRTAVFYPNPSEIAYSVCLPKCPTNITYLDMDKLSGTKRDPVPFSRPKSFSDLIPHTTGAPANQVATYPSSELPGFHRCVPLLNEVKKAAGSVKPPLDVHTIDKIMNICAQLFTSPTLAWNEMIGTVETNRFAILAMLATALVIGFLYLMLLRFLVGPIVWLSIFSVNLLCIAIAALLLHKSRAIDASNLPANPIDAVVAVNDAAKKSNKQFLLYTGAGAP